MWEGRNIRENIPALMSYELSIFLEWNTIGMPSPLLTHYHKKLRELKFRGNYVDTWFKSNEVIISDKKKRRVYKVWLNLPLFLSKQQLTRPHV